ncbi:RNA polymerase sigma factor [Anaerostipes sp.]|uniref:RNA polymerase sigma factor n=1 Tax=Anaerostipes sp. TaxID=1872530 RepID=UPI0025BCFF25|nr:RNA polymerase sigma factor [Anaerostipes sp.]MBS7007491.1 RNA polymerase sigma factor [Anaerostipes sp.]
MREEKFYEELSPYVERAKHGDQDAFAHLYQSTYEMTKWFVLNFCKDRNEAEDILQEIYLDVYRYLPDLKNNLAFCAWQRKISYRCCIKFARQKKDVVVGDQAIESMEKISADENKPQEMILNEEKNQLLLQCITRLPEKQRAAIIMSGLWQMKMREIAEVMDCDINAVKNLLYHGRKNLKKEIQKLAKADREALGIRSFGFIILYPSIRNCVVSSSKQISRYAALAKKTAVTVLAACSGAAALALWQSDPVPAANFRSVVLPEVSLKTEELEGIEIPKEKKRAAPVPVDYSSMNVNKKTKLLEVHVKGKIDYKNTYTKTDSGEIVYPLKYNASEGMLYFPARAENFVLHLMAEDGRSKMYRFYKK